MSAHHEWKAIKRQHGYADGTDGTWCVRYEHDCAGDLIVVEIADWLDEPTARLVAAAPTMQTALYRVAGIASFVQKVCPELGAVLEEFKKIETISRTALSLVDHQSSAASSESEQRDSADGPQSMMREGV